MTHGTRTEPLKRRCESVSDGYRCEHEAAHDGAHSNHDRSWGRCRCGHDENTHEQQGQRRGIGSCVNCGCGHFVGAR